ncbi:uncharacterized protein LALA0_S01e00210g [Lachancea lanzarotensis]|uniref:LALA0S01e00210g1_1 n=1 Tax=Lachancea lanzarotensis TaxID=1245769 RepID=A0A0C7N0D0_9SACH|nr:uncharacterized protein LALA0_S01e00210g [Lachancea lanzarotensis]CEP59976.1 LALA0S01e00210g1_1 [Lachancea lanzarotensis]
MAVRKISCCLIAASSLILLLLFFGNLLNIYDRSSILKLNNNDRERSKPAVSSAIRWDNYSQFTRDLDFENSTALFNSVRAALRQAASDIHPVGVSYFPAVIPEGTLMYHAGPTPPTTFEWLAMDHEFSYSFGLRPPSYGRKSLKKQGRRPYNPLGGTDEKPESSAKMLTYRASKDLNRLFYLDGASAAKTENTGEMDTQEMLSNVIKTKLNLTGDDEDMIMKERLFASRICRWGKPLGLQGIVRVEVGFEVILCDFLSGDVELVSSLEMVSPGEYFELPPPTVVSKDNGWPLDGDNNLVEEDLTEEQRATLDREDSWEEKLSRFRAIKSFNWLRAGAIHDKGEQRIQLDYRYLITGINRTYINNDPNNRRLLNDGMTWDKQLQMVSNLEQALKIGFDATQSTNWQQVFDEISDKFAPMLKILGGILDRNDTSVEERAINATAVTLNFCLRFMSKKGDDTQFGDDQNFAVYQYVRPLKELRTDADYLVWSAAVNVVSKIVQVIYKVNDLLTPIVSSSMLKVSLQDIETIEIAQKEVEDLIHSLGWIEFQYRCKNVCQWDEICYTPSWGPSPMGRQVPGSTQAKKGTHYDEFRRRLVIDNELQCINVDDMLRNAGF